MKDSLPGPTADFLPTATWPRLRLRAELLKRLREFFDQRDFLEVETPLLSSEVIVERNIDPLPVGSTVEISSTSCSSGWLQSSPEAHMKRLLASGAPAIYQVTRSFRAHERGPLHNPEFTLVEWYRPGDSMEEGMQLLSDLVDSLLHRGPAERMTYREAFLRYAKVDPFAAKVSIATLAEVAQKNKISAPSEFGNDRDAWLDLIRDHLVEPHLGIKQPTIVYDWPESQAALARVRQEGVPVAERFELYVEGIELANGYHELTDAAELRRRQAEAAAARERDGQIPLPQPLHLLSAMEHSLPDCSGVALGFDRLVMLAAGARSIEEVLTFPSDRA